jgi:hypothetical protein
VTSRDDTTGNWLAPTPFVTGALRRSTRPSPLAELLMREHRERLASLTRRDRLRMNITRKGRELRWRLATACRVLAHGDTGENDEW